MNNFVFLARYHYFDGIVFHRIIPGFVLQGGDPKGTGRGGPGYRFADELPPPAGTSWVRWPWPTPGPDTNGSQFFVISGPEGVRLPPQYSLFGAVVAGWTSSGDRRRGHAARAPRERVVIESVTIDEED